MKKKLLTIILLISILFTPLLVNAEAKLSLTAKSAFIMEKNTGSILYEDNADVKRPIASITKLMPMYIIFEEIDKGNMKLDDKITVNEIGAGIDGSGVGLVIGEAFTVKEMLTAIAVQSANDCVYAMAAHIDGTLDKFVERMNNTAKELGLKNTVFGDPAGLDNDGHSTARDIAEFCKIFLDKHPEVVDYTSIWSAPFRKGQPNEMTIYNTNQLIRDKASNSIVGMKTGFTTPAGYCLAAFYDGINNELISVVLGSNSDEDRFVDSDKLIKYALSKYDYMRITNEYDFVGSLFVDEGIGDRVNTYIDEGFVYYGNKKDRNKITVNVRFNRDIVAPVNVGDQVGEVIYMLRGKEIGKGNVYSQDSIQRASDFRLLCRDIFGVFGKESPV